MKISNEILRVITIHLTISPLLGIDTREKSLGIRGEWHIVALLNFIGFLCVLFTSVFQSSFEVCIYDKPSNYRADRYVYSMGEVVIGS